MKKQSKKIFAGIRRKSVRPQAALDWLAQNRLIDVPAENILEVKMEGDMAEINIDASIGKSWWDDTGISAKEFCDALNEIPQGKKILVRVNSEGGSIKDGLGIYDAIKARSDDITCRVTGYALSIASVLPLAAGKVVSPDHAIWMIHEAWMQASGNKRDFEKDSKMLGTHDDTMAGLYAKHAGGTDEEWMARMEAETWMTGKEAVELGLADEGDETAEDDAEMKGRRPLCAEYLARCRNIPENIYNSISAPLQGAAKPTPNQPAAPVAAANQDTNKMNKKILAALLMEHGIKNSTGKDFAETDTDAEYETGLKTLAKKPGLAADARMQAIEAQLASAEKRRLTDKILGYVTAGKITNDEADIYVQAAMQDETKTIALLEKKEAIPSGNSPINWTGVDILDAPSEPGVREGLTGLRGPQSEMLVNIRKDHKTPQARHAAIKAVYSQALKQAMIKDQKTGREVLAANTYSSTLVTNFLMDGAITDLVNVWAMLNAFTLVKDVDPYKPLATGQLKHLISGEATQVGTTAPASFEPATGSNVGAITVSMNWFNQPMRVGPTDLNSGLRMADLQTKAIATFADSVVQYATAPITAANFTATPLIRAASAFNFSDLATLQGQLQKSPTKNLILDGNYLSRILNQPGFYQKTGEDLEAEAGYKAFGWEGIYLASNWTGAGNNIKGFACNPQALVRATGLPINPPNIPGGSFTTTTFEIPEVDVACAMSMWFSLATRTMFVSFDVIAGFAAADLTSGVVVASGTPS